MLHALTFLQVVGLAVRQELMIEGQGVPVLTKSIRLTVSGFPTLVRFRGLMMVNRRSQ